MSEFPPVEVNRLIAGAVQANGLLRINKQEVIFRILSCEPRKNGDLTLAKITIRSCFNCRLLGVSLMSSLSEALEFISSWVQQHPNSQLLKPGLSYETIQQKVRDLPFELPTEIYDLYLWRNGGLLELLPYPGLDYECDYEQIHRFFSLDEAINIAVKDWDNSWFPLFDTDGNIFFIVGNEEKRRTSPIFCNDEFELPSQPRFESLTDMMLKVVRAIRS